jgi:RHS repeat-associated protein
MYFTIVRPIISFYVIFSLLFSPAYAGGFHIFQNNAPAVGVMKLHFDVNAFGAASIEIPIKISPGTAGISPQLSLSYNSQASDALVGLGFQLKGLSAITRCNADQAHNGRNHGIDYTNNDVFCINGQQLVAVNGKYGSDGTIYKTYQDTFAKITSHGQQGSGPASFTVHSKNGQIATYGSVTDSPSSQVLAQGSSSVAVWALSKISDRATNYLIVSYTQDKANGAYYPARIDYTGNTNAKQSTYNSLQFVYETRPDPILFYRAGSSINFYQRLKTVMSYSESNLVYEYQLGYQTSPLTGRSRLISLTECGADGSCLKPITFSWLEGDSPNWQPASNFIPVKKITDHLGRDAGMRQVDLNGDGLLDIIQSTLLSDVSVPAAWINGGSNWKPSSNFIPPQMITDHLGRDAGMRLVDINGDGLMDIIQSSTLAGAGQPGAWINTGTGWQSAPAGFIPPQKITDHLGRDAGVRLIDLNGDGLLDMVQHTTLGGVTTAGAWINNRSGWQPANGFTPPQPVTDHLGRDAGMRLIDLDGDGLQDMIQSTHLPVGASGAWINTGSGWKNTPGLTPPDVFTDHIGRDRGLRLLDLNGDSLFDIVSSSGAWINTGAGWQLAPGFTAPNVIADSLGRDAGVRFIDLNGDGLLDIIQSTTLGANNIAGAWINDRSGWQPINGFVPSQPITDHLGRDMGMRVVDLNGDGLTDIIQSSTLAEAGQPGASVNQLGKSDLLAGYTDSLGNTLVINYEPLTNSSVYTRGQGAAYPINDIQQPIYVVSGTSSSNGIGGQHVIEYRYSGARVELTGFGLLGFASVAKSDVSSGLTKTELYSQDTSRHTQRLVVSELTQNGLGVLLGNVTHIWRVFVTGNGTKGSTVYTPLPTNKTTHSYELNGDPISAISKGYLYDSFGNPTDILETAKDTGGVYTTHTTNQFFNNPLDWLLGLVTAAKVTMTSPGQPAITRRSAFSYDQRGFLRTETAEPDNTNFEHSSEHTRDYFGNVVTKTIFGPDIANRTSTVEYDLLGRFPVKKTNALGQNTSFVYDARFGKALNQTDLNGLTTRYQYDGFGRPSLVVRPDGVKSSSSFSWCDNSCPVGAVYYRTTQTTGSRPTTLYFDELNRIISKQTLGFDGRVVRQDTTYDDLDRIANVSARYFAGDDTFWTQYTYDLLGRISKIQYANNGITKFTYDGLTVNITDPLGRTSSKVANVRDWLISTTDAAGSVTQYQYDSRGRPLTITDAHGNQIAYQHDLLGRKVVQDDPDRGVTHYAYDVLGELLNQTDAMGQETSFAYDFLGRLVTQSNPAGRSTWNYDVAPNGIGKLGSVIGISGRSKWHPNATYAQYFSYDGLSRPSQNTTVINGHPYITTKQYDSFGRVSRIGLPGGIGERFKYNRLGYLEEVDLDGSGSIRKINQLDAHGHVVNETFGNGAQTIRSYDPTIGKLIRIHTGDADNNPVFGVNYEYDLIGNLLACEDSVLGLKTTYIYADPLDRVTTYNGTECIQYQYDRIGNINFNSKVGHYNYGENGAGPHAVTSIQGPLANQYRYNQNGEQITNNARNVSYNSFGTPLDIQQSGSAVGFSYDANHNRFIRSDISGNTTVTTHYVGLLKHVEDQNNIVHRYNFPCIGVYTVTTDRKGVVQSQQMNYLHRGRLGSVEAITNNNGTPVQRFQYDPFGNQTLLRGSQPGVGTITTEGYTGHEEIPQMSLIHMNGRMYDPVTGRFISADPFVQAPAFSQSLNRYSYVVNRPTTYSDPSGYFWGLGHAISSIGNAISGAVSSIGNDIGNLATDAWHGLGNLAGAAWHGFEHLGGDIENEAGHLATDIAQDVTHIFNDIGTAAEDAVNDAVDVLKNPYFDMAAGLALGAFTMGIGATWWVGALAQSALTAAEDAAKGDGIVKTIEGAAFTFASTAAWHEEGELLDMAHLGHGTEDWLARSAMHGVLGGGLNALQGRNFINGFLSHATTELFTIKVSPYFGSHDTLGILARTGSQAVIGGTVAAVDGSNIAEGARSAAYGELYKDAGERAAAARKQAACDKKSWASHFFKGN